MGFRPKRHWVIAVQFIAATAALSLVVPLWHIMAVTSLPFGLCRGRASACGTAAFRARAWKRSRSARGSPGRQLLQAVLAGSELPSTGGLSSICRRSSADFASMAPATWYRS